MSLMIISAAGIELNIDIMPDMCIPLYINFVNPQMEDFLEFVDRTNVSDDRLSSRYRAEQCYHSALH